ncbi:hypothetical protein C1752_10363 [Acaryochloris thomasi RCC1774]|uniref:Uncharacterized protein n=1 Tax=Acaryochloris thomasi RCC1774 TaxID=1764569 RepID=A0A2W1JHN9_9CYAN|nr:hypothetical protein [Acaryochloris thomasi]PZD70642.1 hypothetical protein C1752_10363 [Acaryochloris thomasi RCC1774]
MKNAFARVTDIHDAIALTLTPCAGQLYRWLLRKIPAGKPQELELGDFARWSSGHRRRPYCIRHIQRAVQELLSVGLIDVVKQYSTRIFKLICFHPEAAEITPVEQQLTLENKPNLSDKKVQVLDQKVQTVTKMSKTEHSNADAAVPSYRDKKRTADDPTSLHPVSWSDKEGMANSPLNPNLQNPTPQKPGTDSPADPDSQNVPLNSEGRIIDPELKAAVEEVIAQPLNQNIHRTVVSATVDVVRDALAVVRQQKQAGIVKRPAGMLVKAIQEKWNPNPVEESGSLVPDGFSEWFDLAREKGIVTASMMMDGQMCVCTNPELGDWQPWTELAFAFPKRILKGMTPIRFLSNPSVLLPTMPKAPVRLT